MEQQNNKTLIAMAVGVIVMLIIGFSTSWLMERSPRTGGIYLYTKEAFGRDHAFLCAWFLCLSYLTIVSMAIMSGIVIPMITQDEQIKQLGIRQRMPLVIRAVLVGNG